MGFDQPVISCQGLDPVTSSPQNAEVGYFTSAAVLLDGSPQGSLPVMELGQGRRDVTAHPEWFAREHPEPPKVPGSVWNKKPEDREEMSQ